MKRGSWVDNIKRDVRVLGLEGTWTEQANLRIDWRRIVVVWALESRVTRDLVCLNYFAYVKFLLSK